MALTVHRFHMGDLVLVGRRGPRSPEVRGLGKVRVDIDDLGIPYQLLEGSRYLCRGHDLRLLHVSVVRALTDSRLYLTLMFMY